MKKVFCKDYVLRKQFELFELRYKLLKSISVNRYLDLTLRRKALYLLDKKGVFKTQMKNYCLITGRSRGIYSKFRLSRIRLRDYLSMGLIPSYKKSSW